MTTIKVKKLTFFQSIFGVIGKEKIEPIFLKTRFGIHTLGVKVPIDIVILNTKNEIVAIKEKLQPNKFFVWDIRYSYVLELPEGMIETLNLHLHQKINIEFIS